MRTLERDGAAMKHVTHSVNREQNTRGLHVIIELSPEHTDVHVNCPRASPRRIEMPYVTEKFVARNECARFACQAGQQRNLKPGELIPSSITVADLATRPVHSDNR